MTPVIINHIGVVHDWTSDKCYRVDVVKTTEIRQLPQKVALHREVTKLQARVYGLETCKVCFPIGWN